MTQIQSAAPEKPDKQSRTKFYLILSFLIPMVLMGIGFLLQKVHPFGDRQILVVDCWHQCEGAGGGIRTFSETGDCVSDGAQHAASFRLRPHGAGGGSGDVPPPEGDFITGRLSEEVKVLEAALA